MHLLYLHKYATLGRSASTSFAARSTGEMLPSDDGTTWLSKTSEEKLVVTAPPRDVLLVSPGPTSWLDIVEINRFP